MSRSEKMSRETFINYADCTIAKDLCNMNLEYEDQNNATSFFTSEGNIHPYPAKAVPNMVHDLLCKLKEIYDIKTVVDPFVGSGTVALESKILGLDFYGCDLNPLAVLLARTKSLTIKGRPYIKQKLGNFTNSLNQIKTNEILYKIENFKNIGYWFKNENIEQLSYLKHSIDCFLKTAPKIYKRVLSLIVLTALSATIRESSLTRPDEFKLYRLPPAEINKFQVDSIQIYIKHIEDLLDMIYDVNTAFQKDTICKIFLNNAKNMTFMNEVRADLVLTSPPYGDSKSTVAYGQFSRLSIQWMSDLMKKYLKIDVFSENCDEYLLGGRYSIRDNQCVDTIIESSETLMRLMEEIQLWVETQLDELHLAQAHLGNFEDHLNNGLPITSESLIDDSILANIIREKIRLYVYRKINQSVNKSNKKVKDLTLTETNNIISDLLDSKSKQYHRRIEMLRNLLPKIQATIKRKILHLPKRKDEVLYFFIDLYQVVLESHRVINDKGIQVWIVGHRTVLGNIEVKMVDILREWFESLNYSTIALIKRNYHFKRLPHHINSTITRTKEVKTMMEEHILIIKNNNV